MSATYPTPTTPLPWQDRGLDLRDDDYMYLVHAANAFPHLVAALEMVHTHQPAIVTLTAVARALAIARGETPP